MESFICSFAKAKVVSSISQPAHAWLAGRLAAEWGNAVFKTPAPCDEVICATALHDIGWLEWEHAPVLDQSTRFPLEFQNVPAEIHTRLWQRGIEHAAAYGALPALLISRHGDAIYDRTFDATKARSEAVSAVMAFRSAQSIFQRETIRRLTVDPSFADAVMEANLAFTTAFIVAVDTISLNLCWGLTSDVEVDDVPFSNEKTGTIFINGGSEDDISVHPWPFRNPTVRVSIEGKLLDRPSRDQADLDQLLKHAPSTLHHFDLVKGP